MVTLNPEYVVDKDQKPKAVLVTMEEWEQIVSELEELDDIRAYDEAKLHADDTIPFEQAVAEIRKGYQA